MESAVTTTIIHRRPNRGDVVYTVTAERPMTETDTALVMHAMAIPYRPVLGESLIFGAGDAVPARLDLRQKTACSLDVLAENAGEVEKTYQLEATIDQIYSPCPEPPYEFGEGLLHWLNRTIGEEVFSEDVIMEAEISQSPDTGTIDIAFQGNTFAFLRSRISEDWDWVDNWENDFLVGQPPKR